MRPLAELGSGVAPMVIAHRGDSGHAPENTLAAIDLAIAAGAPMVEIDVQLSHDGRAVVIHDRSVARTTNGRGSVGAMSYSRIAVLDAGGWFAERFKGERLPLLSEVLEHVQGRSMLNIELKLFRSGASRGAELVHVVVDEVRAAGMQRHTLISSFDHSLVELARTIDPGIARGVIVHPLEMAAPSRRALALEAFAVVLPKSRLRAAHIRRLHDDGMRVFVYTVNHQADMLRTQRLGVDGIFTNYPGLALELFEGNRGEGIVD